RGLGQRPRHRGGGAGARGRPRGVSVARRGRRRSAADHGGACLSRGRRRRASRDGGGRRGLPRPRRDARDDRQRAEPRGRRRHGRRRRLTGRAREAHPGRRGGARVRARWRRRAPRSRRARNARARAAPRRWCSMSANVEPVKHRHNPLVRYFRTLGPGLVTGAADDDPSGVTTYAVAGAAYGTGMLWTALATLPLMAAIQLTCARIGLVSGRGLAGAMREPCPPRSLLGACVLLLVANVFNIAADLAGMADSAEMLTGLASGFWVALFGLIVLLITIYTSYPAFAAWLKWLTAVLFAYVISAVLAHPDW